MKPLEQSFKTFVLLCICPPDPTADKWIKLRNFSFLSLAISFVLLGNISSITFIMKYIGTDLENSLFACLQVAALTETIYTIFVALLIRNKITMIFDEFQTFYDSSKIYFKINYAIPCSF